MTGARTRPSTGTPTAAFLTLAALTGAVPPLAWPLTLMLRQSSPVQRSHG
jgi:hypothetical protein